MLRALILTPLLILAATGAGAAVHGPGQASGSATLSLAAATGVRGAWTMPATAHRKAATVEATLTLPRK